MKKLNWTPYRTTERLLSNPLLRALLLTCVSYGLYSVSSFGSPDAHAPQIGKPLPNLSLSGKEGGKVSGGAWNSQDIQGKVQMLIYVDPDNKDLNTPFEEAVQKGNFPAKKWASTAIVNLEATWIPNALIQSSLEEKQKKFPRTTYVMDKEKALVKKAGFPDDNYYVVLVDHTGKVLTSHTGKLQNSDIAKFVDIAKNAVSQIK